MQIFRRSKGLLAAMTICSLAIISVASFDRSEAAIADGVSFAVTGYLPVGRPADATIRKLGPSVSDLGVDGAVLGRDARSIVQGDHARGALAASHAIGRPASFLISNYDVEAEDWDPDLATALLGSAGNRLAVAADIAAEVGAHGWDGVTIDLEALTHRDERGLVEFLRELRRALPSGSRLDIAIPAPGVRYGNWDGFDVPAIATIVDHVVVMGYDQHHTGTGPGPVGGLRWVRRAIADSAAVVEPAKLRIGVAGYGYRWQRGRGAESVSVDEARRLAGRRARWSRRHGEWHARLRDGSVLWWSDRRSIAARYSLARRSGLQGAAVWSLSAVDSLP